MWAIIISALKPKPDVAASKPLNAKVLYLPCAVGAMVTSAAGRLKTRSSMARAGNNDLELPTQWFLRDGPERSCGIARFSQHEPDGCERQEGEGLSIEISPILGQLSASPEPGEGAFHHPSLRQDGKAFGVIRALADPRRRACGETPVLDSRHRRRVSKGTDACRIWPPGRARRHRDPECRRGSASLGCRREYAASCP